MARTRTSPKPAAKKPQAPAKKPPAKPPVKHEEPTTFHLANPLMRGPGVERLQRALAKHGYLPESEVDGVFGPHTGLACKEAKYDLGYKDADIKPYGGTLLMTLMGKTDLPEGFKTRAKMRKALNTHSSGKTVEQHKRELAVEWMLWSITHEPQIHYAQERLMDMNHITTLPQVDDCSEWFTKMCKYAGIPDPNGHNFDGIGYTGTLIQSMKHVTLPMLKPGDAIVFGAYPGHHVCGVLQPGADPLLGSHGQERGPFKIRFSEEAKYQPPVHHYLTHRKF